MAGVAPRGHLWMDSPRRSRVRPALSGRSRAGEPNLLAPALVPAGNSAEASVNRPMTSRQPIQVLVIPYRLASAGLEILALRRRDVKVWQFVAGGAHEGESLAQAALRESQEELGSVLATSRLMPLETQGTIPRYHFSASWPDSILVIPEHAFAVNCEGLELSPTQEHDLHQWLRPELAWSLLRFDSNRTALWELCQRLGVPLDTEPSWQA